MRSTWQPLLLAALLLACVAALPAAPLQSADAAAPQSERVRSGVSHFDRAFYELTPHKRDTEATREFDLAVADFERELAVNPSSAVAHQYLARIQAARNNHLEAARHYDRVIDLRPLDVDACVLAALEYVEVGRVEEARARLTTAQARTSDPNVLAKLAEYLGKLDALSR
jgi:tetratricopeptide (TPR) repeat protein